MHTWPWSANGQLMVPHALGPHAVAAAVIHDDSVTALEAYTVS